MNMDNYKVKVLHFINPHIIWVLVRKESEVNVVFYEQIGIYGILPVDIRINFDGNLTTKRSEEWSPGVTLKMQEILSEGVEVSFSVSYVDRTTSLFDNNMHKYGDLFIKMKNLKTLSLREELLDTGFVVENLNFHQYLKTELDYITSVNVINKIKQSIKLLDSPNRYFEEVLKNQTSVVSQIIELEEMASVNNHETQLLVRKHVNDLNACKDVDDESAGRANYPKISMSNLALAKKLNLIKSESNSVVEASILGVKRENIVKNINLNEEVIDTKLKGSEYIPREPSRDINIHRKGKKIKADNDKIKKFMALGPPGLNPLQYHLKEVSKERDIVPETVIETKVLTESETKEQIDDFDGIDSEVNVRIDDLSLSKLKDSLEDSNKEHNESNKSDHNYDEKSSFCVEHNSFVRNQSTSRKMKYLRDQSKNDVKLKDCVVDSGKENNESSCSDLNYSEIKSFGDEQHFCDRNQATNRRMKYLREKISKMSDSSSSGETDSALRKGDDSDSDSITSLVNKLDISTHSIKKEVKTETDLIIDNVKNNVNPFKNLDGSKSVFVEKLLSPILMVHTKNENCIQPVSNSRDIPFGTEIHVILQNMSVKKPMRPQTISWPVILRGHSLFLVSPCGSGKTMGYLPAVCRLVNDCRQSAVNFSVTPLSCIIVCATAKSVSQTEELCKMFLHGASVFACYTGMTDISISTTLLNGCDILISTPPSLVRLMRDNLGLDLRNLNTLVIDDCERIDEVYRNELKFCLFKIKEMLKCRVNKEVKVQYVVTSRIWCDFMSALAKKAPDSVVCIAAFQECVLYSKVDTSVEFIKKENKINALVKFLEDIDKSKKTVIACRSDDEVHLIEKTLTNLKYIVFPCDSKMTVQDLYRLELDLSDYQEPLLGPVLVCCDSNLTHLNVSDAHYLVHFSLPLLFSMFCKRFAALSDNYQSIFSKQNIDVKIKIFLEDTNVEQLPKILNFIKRCNNNVPSRLEQLSDWVMVEKDMKKAETFVPLCNALLTLGKCPDIWNCRHRHTILKSFDEPRSWLPKDGVITFKILHYHSAVHYSARMISCLTPDGVKKYNNTYNIITIRMGMYFSKESNRKLHGRANPGDICGVSLKLNLFARCRVMKILNFSQNNLPSLLLINLIDEEKYEIARDTCLYHLPDDLKSINTHAVQVILSNIAPADRDITYSKIAENQLKRITETNEDLFMKANVSLVIGNCIFVETLEACQDLSSLNETVVKSNFRNELLQGHAVNNPDHIKTLKNLSKDIEFMRISEVHAENIQVPKPIKILPTPRWAHLESDIHVPVYYLCAKSPGLFFVQHVKFQDCLNILIKNIKKYIAENPEPITNVKKGDIVLAEFPSDKSYERARIDSVINNSQVKCFFVDLGDWATVSVDRLLPVTEQIITHLPFQAIECRLIGIKPVGEKWSEFSTNWLVDQFYDNSSKLKYLFAKRFTKEEAEFTEGTKYGIGLIDTYANDVCINRLMIDANLAEENDEIELLDDINIVDENKSHSDDSDLKRDTCVFTGNDEPKETNLNVIQLQSKCNGDLSPQCSSNLNKDFVKHANGGHSKLTNEKLYKYKTSKNNIKCISKLHHDGLQNDKEYESVSTNVNMPIDTQESRPDDEDVLKNIGKDQKTVMNLFRRMPLRSVPLVENDDFDDDKWDSINPLLMLKNPHQTSTNNLSPISKKKFGVESKILKPAICYSKADTEPFKDQGATSNLSDLQNKDLQFVSSTSDDLLIESTDPLNKKNVQSSTTVNKPNILVKQGGTAISVDDENTAVPKSVLGVNSIINDSNYETNADQTTNKAVSNLKRTFVSTCTPNLDYASNKIKNTYNKLTNSDVTESKKFENDLFRKPKLVWRQNQSRVIVKIQIIADEFDLNITDKYLQFYAYTNDEEYGFEFELYGVVDVKKSLHSNKGQYILVSLYKVMTNKHWLTLSKGNIKKWIVYDVDGIDVSSDEENETVDENNLKKQFIDVESETEDDFDDDLNFAYKKNY